MQHPEVKDFKYWSNLAFDLEYMEQLLKDLSDFSKSETLQLSTFSLGTLLEKIALSFAADVVNSDIEFTAKISPSIPQITGDKTKLQEVFLNLLKNAFDAASPNKTIYLEANLCDNHISVIVSDTGCGMTEEQLSNIFKPFVTYKKNGSGLGLAICENIIKAHGGTITVESTLHKGTRFSIDLPLL
jgi:signal transduction histidine kinase